MPKKKPTKSPKAQKRSKVPKLTKLTKIKARKSAPASNPAWEVIYKAVERIPRGSVSTYGAVAQLAGLPRRARLVGTALKSLPAGRTLPWHRVVTASGRLAFATNSDPFIKQSKRLAREGVRLVRGRVDFARHGWPREDKSLDELLWGNA